MLLALDTSTLTLSVALAERVTPTRDDAGEADPEADAGSVRILASLEDGPPPRHSELLPGAIDTLLTQVGAARSALSGIAVGLGPGSFTGLRVGLATARTLGLVMRLPVGGCSSLAALVHGAPAPGRYLAMAFARRGEVYFGAYERGPGNAVRALEEEGSGSLAEVVRRLRDDPTLRALGPGVAALEEGLLEGGVDEGRLVRGVDHPTAAAVAALTVMPTAFSASDLAALEPRYLRPAEAERDPKFPPLPGPPPKARIE